MSHLSEEDVLEISSVGYQTISRSIKDFISNSNIVLAVYVMGLGEVVVKSDIDILGRVVAGGAIAIRCTRNIKYTEKIDSSVKKILGKELFKAYPNPVLRGSEMNIEFKTGGEYSLLLFDNSSKLILSKIINPLDGTNTLLLINENISAGIYYLRAVDEKTKKSFSQKIIIQ